MVIESHLETGSSEESSRFLKKVQGSRFRASIHKMVIESHRDMTVWKKSMQLVGLLYAITQAFPKEEQFGITSQLRRAAVSVPCNIAEGHARATRKDFAGFVAIAKGSLVESETLLLIAVQQHYISIDKVQPALSLMHDLERMLAVLRSKPLKLEKSAHVKMPADVGDAVFEP